MKTLDAYMHGAGVFVPAHVAAWLDGAAKLRDLRARVRGNDSEVDAVLQAIGVVALQYRTGSRVGTQPVPMPELTTDSTVLDTRQAADRLGLRQRSITKAITTGALPAAKIGGRWVLYRQDVDNYGRAA